MRNKVLLVDDEEVFSQLTQQQLARRGFDVTVVSTGEEALEKALSQPPDVILLDVLLPGIDGGEVLRRLKADPRTKGTPVLICSITVKERAAIQKFITMGADGFVAKPCRPDDLADKLRTTLARSSPT